MRLVELRKEGERRLESAGIPGGNFEISLLIEHMFCYNRTEQLLHGRQEIDPEKCGEFLALVQRRGEGYPLQYLLGSWEFYGLPFLVGEGVLPPRPDTEVLVEACLERVQGREAPAIVDLCSGSGCISVALERNLPGSKVTAVELSPQAFGYLEKNIRLNGSGVQPVLGDALVWEAPEGSLDLVVSNPPYIARGEEEYLSRETAYEPEMALFAGDGGLAFYRDFARRCPRWLKPEGWLAVEIGFSQGDQVRELFSLAGLFPVQVLRDYGGNPRVVLGQKREKS